MECFFFMIVMLNLSGMFSSKGQASFIKFFVELTLIVAYFLECDIGKRKCGIDCSQFASQRCIKRGDMAFVNQLMLYFSPGILKNREDLNFNSFYIKKWYELTDSVGNFQHQVGAVVSEFTNSVVFTFTLHIVYYISCTYFLLCPGCVLQKRAYHTKSQYIVNRLHQSTVSLLFESFQKLFKVAFE